VLGDECPSFELHGLSDKWKLVESDSGGEESPDPRVARDGSLFRRRATKSDRLVDEDKKGFIGSVPRDVEEGGLRGRLQGIS